jgi:hypothetical protein
VTDLLGWLATTLVVASYFSRHPARLRLLQMIGASVWTIYGVVIGASPVIVANVLVFSAAAWTARRAHRPSPTDVRGLNYCDDRMVPDIRAAGRPNERLGAVPDDALRLDRGDGPAAGGRVPSRDAADPGRRSPHTRLS